MGWTTDSPPASDPLCATKAPHSRHPQRLLTHATNKRPPHVPAMCSAAPVRRPVNARVPCSCTASS
eukprot:4227522-Prymnesium_polylepis.1